MTIRFDSKRIGILVFIHAGGPAPGPYLLHVGCLLKKNLILFHVKCLKDRQYKRCLKMVLTLPMLLSLAATSWPRDVYVSCRATQEKSLVESRAVLRSRCAAE